MKWVDLWNLSRQLESWVDNYLTVSNWVEKLSQQFYKQTSTNSK